MVLKTLDTLGRQHGYGIAQRIQQVSEDVLHLNQGTLYPALLRLEQQGWIASEWGASENNRRARYYSLTRSGHKQLVAETESWERMSAIMTRLYDVKSTDPLTYGAVALPLILIALAANLAPARRAVSVDPTVALRHE